MKSDDSEHRWSKLSWRLDIETSHDRGLFYVFVALLAFVLAVVIVIGLVVITRS